MIRVSRSTLALLSMVLTACGGQRESVEMLVADAETAYDAMRAEVTRVAPDQARAIEDEIAAVRGKLAAGEYPEALASARELQPRMKELSDRLPAMRAELESSWRTLKTSLPGTMSSLGRQLRPANRPVTGTRRALFDAARTALLELEDQWGEAVTAMQDGRLAEAVTRAESVRLGLASLATRVHEGS